MNNNGTQEQQVEQGNVPTVDIGHMMALLGAQQLMIDALSETSTTTKVGQLIMELEKVTGQNQQLQAIIEEKDKLIEDLQYMLSQERERIAPDLSQKPAEDAIEAPLPVA